MALRNFGDGQEMVHEDLNAIPKAVYRQLFDRALFEILQRKQNAFFSDSLKVLFSTAQSVVVKSGSGFISDPAAVSPDPKNVPVVVPENRTVNIPDAHPTLPRIDLICVSKKIVTELTGERFVKNPGDDSVSSATLVLQKNWDSDITVVQGLPSADPEAPAAPAGKIVLAEVLVAAGTGIANQAAITDHRLLFPLGPEILLDTSAAKVLAQNESSRLADIISQIDLELYSPNDVDVAIGNDIINQPIPGLVLDKAVIKSAIIHYDIYRKTDTPDELSCVGVIKAMYKPIADQWILSFDGESFDETGTTIQVDEDGQFHYSTTDLIGPQHVGRFRCQIIKIYK